MLQDYRFKSNHPNKTSTLKFTLEFEPFSVVICFPIKTIISTDDLGRNSSGLKEFDFKSLSFKAIKSKTDALKETIESFTLNYGFKEKPIKRNVSDKVFFKSINFDDEARLSRCFLVDFEFAETKFESLLPTNFLNLKFRNKHWAVYLVDKKQPFTSQSASFKGEFYIGKYRKERLPNTKKSNCVNYGEDIRLNCKTRSECIDRCVVRSYLDKRQSDRHKIPLFWLVDLDQLNSSEQEYRFTENRDLQVEKQCASKFNRDDCTESYFYDSLKTAFDYEENSIRINLNFEKIVEKELSPSLVKTILNVVNLESIFFGTNLAGLLSTLLLYAKKLFKFKWRPIFRYLIFFVCFCGFSLHNASMFVGIIQDPLVDNGYFEKLSSYYLPNPIFCFPINETELDEHHRLTGDYLDKVTENYLNYELIFDEIWYFNGTFKNTFYPKNEPQENSNTEISVVHWYFMDLKCYEVVSLIILREEDYYFSGTKYVLGVYFKSNFTDRIYQKDDVYFLFRKDNTTKQFSSSFFFGIKTKKGQPYKRYDVIFEQLEIEEIDRFETLKNLKKLFFSSIDLRDPTTYLNGLTETFKADYGLVTREVLLENYRNLEIDDELFRQYYMQVQNVTDHQYPAASSSKQTLHNLYPTYYESSKNRVGFSFSLSLASRISSTTNDDNWAKIIQNLINSLSLWTGSNILELHVCFSRIGQPFSFLYQLLLKLRRFLKRLF